MKNRLIPNTKLNVSPICLGTMTFGSPVGETEAIKITQWAIDHGVNFIDTANMYEGYTRVLGSAGGVAEEYLGKALRGRRDQAIIATKVGMKVGNAPEDEFTSPAAIRKHLDKSLRRLACRYVDIYYLHKSDPNTPLADTLGALSEAIHQGKVRHYGISNFSAEQTTQLLKVADENHLPRPVIHQPPFSLLKRDIENDLLPLCRKEGIAVAPYQVLQGGLLTGKYQSGRPLPVDSRKAEKDGWVWELTDELFNQLEAIDKQARAKGLSMTQYAIDWVISQPGITSAVVGVKRIDQLEGIIAAAS